MKFPKYFWVTASLTLISIAAHAQVTNDFESGNRDVYAADCWNFGGTTVSATDMISDSFSLRSGNHTNNTESDWRKVYTPFVFLSGAHTIDVSHKRTAGPNLIFEIILIDKGGLSQTVFTRENYLANTVFNESVDINATGEYRILFQTRPVTSSTSRSIMDNISINATDVADRNSLGHVNNPNAYCDCLQQSPVTGNDESTLDEDTSVTIDVLVNDSDADGDLDPTSVSIITGPVFGTAGVDALTGEITYTPDPNFFGWDALTYQVSDQYPYGDVNTATATINFTVTGINDAPTSADRTINIEQNETYTFSGADIAYNDVDGDCFNGFKIVTELTPDLGELYYDGDPIVLDIIYIDPSLLSFVPTFEASGTTEFDFRVVDDQGAESENYTMTIIIEDVNNNPSAENIIITMPANTVHDFSTELVYSDAENDPMGGFVLSSLPGQGQLSYNMNPAVTAMLYNDFTLLSFTPDSDESGEPYTSFTFMVEDINGAQSSDILVTVNVIPEEINLLVSEGFSPNGDDVNDLWYIRDIDKFPNNRIQIYNRWGSLVKTFEGYDNESRVWRGESDAGSQQVTDGSYFYIISLGDGSAPLQGYVVLHR